LIYSDKILVSKLLRIYDARSLSTREVRCVGRVTAR
jgi:hypothetical protein